MEKATKFLKKKSDGYIYPYTPELAARNDMLPHDEEPEVDVIVQDHLTVKMKWEAGLPLTQAEIIAYPKYMTPKVMEAMPAAVVAEVAAEDKKTRPYVRKEKPVVDPSE